jgi:hypothetical protein
VYGIRSKAHSRVLGVSPVLLPATWPTCDEHAASTGPTIVGLPLLGVSWRRFQTCTGRDCSFHAGLNRLVSIAVSFALATHRHPARISQADSVVPVTPKDDLCGDFPLCLLYAGQ